MMAVDVYMAFMLRRGIASPVRHPDAQGDYMDSFGRKRRQAAVPWGDVLGPRAKGSSTADEWYHRWTQEQRVLAALKRAHGDPHRREFRVAH